jgi:hypothetical protein
VELLLETRCDFTLTTTGRHRDDITTCSERSFEATATSRGGGRGGRGEKGGGERERERQADASG